MTIEASEEWESIGNTQALGVFIDEDRIFTSGTSHNGVLQLAQLRAWSWGSLILENTVEWYSLDSTLAKYVFVTDMDGDNIKDVMTVEWNIKNNAQFNVWNYVSDLTHKNSLEWSTNSTPTQAHNIHVDDVDNDGVNEILTCGNTNDF